MQIICLNRALKCADSTLVVPLFFAGAFMASSVGEGRAGDGRLTAVTWLWTVGRVHRAWVGAVQCRQSETGADMKAVRVSQIRRLADLP
jgi:hypothetical protein